MKCRHCGQPITVKAGHYQTASKYTSLFCKQSPSTWHEPDEES